MSKKKIKKTMIFLRNLTQTNSDFIADIEFNTST